MILLDKHPINFYKSLLDVYLKESFAKPVPPLPRQKIINEQPGMAEILIQTDDDKIIGPMKNTINRF